MLRDSEGWEETDGKPLENAAMTRGGNMAVI
jgi:hypothetical protein